MAPMAPNTPDRKRTENGRVAPGDYSPGAPTDPYVQDSRIRFLKQHLRFSHGLRTTVMNPWMLSAGVSLTR